jgi:hypothetical protein
MKPLSHDTGSPEASRFEPLRFAMAPAEKLTLPPDLASELVPVEETPLAFFAPLIVWQAENSPVIIDGCKRFAAGGAQGRKEYACAIIEAPFEPVRAGLLRIGLNSTRELHLREKFLFIRWLHAHLDREAYLRESDKLRITPQERHEIERLLDCKEPLIESVLRGDLDIAIAPEVTHMADPDAQALTGLFREISFSRQMQRELAEWLYEIAFAGKITLAQLLASNPFAQILSDKRLNAPQKAARFHEIAHERRFPLYSKSKSLWAEHGRKVNPDPRAVSFQASPYFERKNIEVRIRLTDAGGARELMQKFALLSEEDWRKLIDPTCFI